MDRLFDEFLGEWPSLGKSDAFMPPLDVSESDKEVVVAVELPGMSEKDIEVSFSSGRLTISGEKTSEREEKNKAYHITERSSGRFSRTVELGESVDSDKASAAFKDGILTVKVPKVAGVSPRKIAIKTG
jgi:HSP20 family protein